MNAHFDSQASGVYRPIVTGNRSATGTASLQGKVRRRDTARNAATDPDGCRGEMSISVIGSGRAGRIEVISNEGRRVVLELDADRVERRAGVLLECLGDSPVH